MNIDQLTPLQASALREAIASPTRSLVRNGKQYVAQHPRESTSGIKRVQTFTYRLVAMLERRWLVEFDEPQFPSRATLTRKGVELAEQLGARDAASTKRPTKGAAAIALAVATALLLAACTAPPTPPPPPAKGAWTLVWCGGMSGWGCGAAGRALYPDKASCYEALAAMHEGDQPVAESGLKRNTVALCRPAAAGDSA